jgi:hypothetical protein
MGENITVYFTNPVTGVPGTSGTHGTSGLGGSFYGSSGTSGTSGRDGTYFGSSGTSGTSGTAAPGTSGRMNIDHQDLQPLLPIKDTALSVPTKDILKQGHKGYHARYRT